ncbi:MAG TPA: hypothetical protein VN025_20580 [Candidatus Dormibacteraeota bacterium]|jgi:hypothetical protein|nr:hypothetical protein [Candidatus Dormibacteraeota bacterium]
MRRLPKLFAFVSLVSMFSASSSLAQNGNFSSITGTSTPQPPVPIPIFSIHRTSNVVTVSTTDPNNTDEYAQQNQIGATVNISKVAIDPSNAVNGNFVICGPSTPGCVTPTTSTFSFVSNGVDFSGSGTQLGYTAVSRTPCPLIPNGYFSFCGDSRPGAGLTFPADGSLLEVISTQDQVGSMLWASALGDGNSGSNRVTGCEQFFIESGNEWHFECSWLRNFGGYIDIDMKNQWLTLDVGDGLTTRGVGGEFAMSGTRKLASFGIGQNRTLVIDMGTSVPGSVIPSSGTLRFRNGSTICWQNAQGSSGLCQGTDANDHFSFDSGIVTATYNTATSCANFWGQCGSSAAGSVALSPNAQSLVISTTAVTAQSQIFVQEDSSLNGVLGITCNTNPGRSYLVSSRTPGNSFQITVSSPPEGAPACLSYHIIN